MIIEYNFFILLWNVTTETFSYFAIIIIIIISNVNLILQLKCFCNIFI